MKVTTQNWKMRCWGGGGHCYLLENALKFYRNFRANTYFKKTYITAVLKRWNKKVYCSAIKILGTPHARGRSVIINKPWWCCRVKPLTPFWVSQTPQRQQHQDRNIRHGYCRIYLNRKMMLWEFSCQTVQDILSVSNTSGTATSR